MLGIPYHEYAYTTFSRHDWPTLLRIRVHGQQQLATVNLRVSGLNSPTCHFLIDPEEGITTHNVMDGW
jgi:hypothetical protein